LSVWAACWRRDALLGCFLHVKERTSGSVRQVGPGRSDDLGCSAGAPLLVGCNPTPPQAATSAGTRTICQCSLASTLVTRCRSFARPSIQLLDRDTAGWLRQHQSIDMHLSPSAFSGPTVSAPSDLDCCLTPNPSPLLRLPGLSKSTRAEQAVPSGRTRNRTKWLGAAPAWPGPLSCPAG